jgi:hypothetical protein
VSWCSHRCTITPCYACLPIKSLTKEFSRPRRRFQILHLELAALNGDQLAKHRYYMLELGRKSRHCALMSWYSDHLDRLTAPALQLKVSLKHACDAPLHNLAAGVEYMVVDNMVEQAVSVLVELQPPRRTSTKSE